MVTHFEGILVIFEKFEMNCTYNTFIFGETWSKGSNLTSLLLINVFAEVAEVNAKAPNIKSYQP